MYIMYAYIYMYIYTFICVLLLFSPSVLFDSLWPHWPPGSIHASLSFTVSQSLLTLMSIELVIPSNHLILCYSYLLLPSVFPSIRIFSSESTLCNPMNCSTPGLPIPHHLPKLAQAHIHCISDVIQSSHPLTPPSLSTLNLSQNQGLFQWVNCSHQMNKILELQLQHQSFQWIFRSWFPLGFTGLMSLQSKGLSRVFSSTGTTVWKHQFFSAQLSL